MIGKLLYLANSRPPSGKDRKERFYAMKQRICERFGTPDGFDVQHFAGKRCFSCYGTGIYRSEYSDYQNYCYKCNGSGWFKRERWVVLKRWRIGQRIFHQPDGVSYEAPNPPLRTIEGFIEHAYHGFWHEEAAMLLALMFDRELLGMLLAEGSTYCKWPRWLGPMVQLKQVVGVTRRMYRSMKQRCDTCGCHTWSVFTNRCQRCKALRENMAPSSDIPF